MPLFGGKKKKDISKRAPSFDPPPPVESPRQYAAPGTNGKASGLNGATQSMPPEDSDSQTEPPKLVFHCQLAHGSATRTISGFTNVRELYARIAESFEIEPSEILFCTLNTHKADMTQLLGGQLGLDDFVFAHCRGRPKVVDIQKTEEALGLTITDNGAGAAFIKAIKHGSVVDKIDGDHIEKIGDRSMVGCRHVEVAKALKEMPKGTVFSLRVVEPLKSGFSEIGGKSGNAKKSGYGTGKETLRLRSKGAATVEVPDDVVNTAIDKINSLMESFLGINDTELAQTIWETGNAKKNPSEFTTALEESDLADFGFTESFIFDLWGAISDAKEGRLAKMQNFSEEF